MQYPESLPVIIAAHNEEQLISRTLRHLPAGEVSPMVVSNASTDRTAEIARSFGATVFELEDAGKLPAQQAAVRHLRDQGYSPQKPVLLMDADSFPIAPKGWARVMGRHEPGTPSFTSGLTGYTDGNLAVDTLRTLKRYKQAATLPGKPGENLDTVYGVNMAVAFGTDDLREQFLDMPHIWPGEDRATASMITEAGGTFHQSLDPRSLVLASARYTVSLRDRLRNGREHAQQQVTADYTARRAPTATHAFDAVSRTMRPLSADGS